MNYVHLLTGKSKHTIGFWLRKSIIDIWCIKLALPATNILFLWQHGRSGHKCTQPWAPIDLWPTRVVGQIHKCCNQTEPKTFLRLFNCLYFNAISSLFLLDLILLYCYLLFIFISYISMFYFLTTVLLLIVLISDERRLFVNVNKKQERKHCSMREILKSLAPSPVCMCYSIGPFKAS